MSSLRPTDNRAFALDSHTRRIAIVVVLGMIMSILDTTIVNVALDSLSRDLHTPLNDIQWVVSAYLLALAAVIPLSGWAVRRYGAFRVYMLALWCCSPSARPCAAWPPRRRELIAFRALQGLGGGMLAPTGLTILVNAAGRDNLPKVMSAIGVPMVLAPVFGPTLGGFLLQSVSWHAIFMVNVPIGIVTALVAMRLLPRDRPDKGERRTAGLAGTGPRRPRDGRHHLRAVAERHRGKLHLAVGHRSRSSLGLCCSCAVRPAARRIDHPLLDLRLYPIRAYSAATVVMFCLGAALFGAMILLPLYFQVARGQDAIHTGLLLIPQGIGASDRHEPLGAGHPPVRGRSDLARAGS